MPLYPYQPINGAQMAMQGMGQASQSYAAMGQKREQTTKQNKTIGDAVMAGGGGALMGASLASTGVGASALNSLGGMLGLGAGATTATTVGAAGATAGAAGGAAAGAAGGAAAGSVAGPLGMGIGALIGLGSMFL